jgi:glycosyltransferase involved in cell wall biosynthesis
MNRIITIINASRKNDGITIGLIKTASQLKKAGYDVKWYQIKDRYTLNQMPASDYTLNGITFFPEKISMGISRSRFISKKLRNDISGLVILSEPTLISFLRYFPNAIVKFHDFRPFTKFSDKMLTALLYKTQLNTLRKVRFAIFTTEYIRNEAHKYGIKPEASLVIKDRPRFGIAQNHLGVSLHRMENKSTTVTCISTDRPYKNIPFFLQLAEQLETRNPKTYKFILVTKPTWKLARMLRHQNKVNVIESVEDIKSVYEQTDILVIPSQYEGFGLPLIEASYYGIPTVAYALPPFIELLGRSELLQNSFDVLDWAKFVERLSLPSFYKEISTFLINKATSIENENINEKLKSFFDSIFDMVHSGSR